MPVLADNDRTKNLMEKGTRVRLCSVFRLHFSEPYVQLMDPVVVGRKRSLLWGMLFIFSTVE